METEWLQVHWLLTLVIIRLAGSYAHCLRPASQGSTLLQITSPGKEQNAKFKISFLLNAYHFHTTLKSKNHRLNHPKLGTA